MWGHRVVAPAVAMAALLVPGTAAIAAAPAGAPMQLAAPNACIANTALGGCAGGGGFSGPLGIAIAPDGTDVYVNNQLGGLGVYARDPATGTLSNRDDLAEHASQASGVAVSPDGTMVAAVSGDPGNTPAGFLDIWRRNADHSLDKLFCVSEQSGVTGCGERDGIGMAQGVAFPPSGAGIYVAGEYGGGDLDGNGDPDGALAVFRPGSFMSIPVLNEVQCIPASPSTVNNDKCKVLDQDAEPGLQRVEKVLVSPDGADVYAYSFNGILGFTRDAATGALNGRVACLERLSVQPTCTDAGPMLGVGGGLAISPDGRNLFAGGQGGGGLTVLTRQPASGALSILECFNDSGAHGCTKVDGMGGVDGDVAVSPDGTLVFTASGGSGVGEVRTFRRDPATGHLTPLACASVTGQPGCTAGSGLFWASAPVASGDGRNLYVAAYQGTSSGGSGALAEFRLAAAPACSGAAVSVAAGATVALPLACTDGDGDAVTRAIAGGPSQGTLGAIDQAAGTVAYTAAAGAAGPDAVTFTGSDGANASAPATVTIDVTPAAPAAGGGAPAPVGGSSAADAAPSSRITTKAKHGSLRASSLKSIAGTASDDHGVARVDVLVLRLDGGAKPASAAKARAKAKAKKACRRLGSNGRLKTSTIRRGRCSLVGFLRATGTTKWKLKLSRRLPKGTYVITSRATDSAGHAESSFSTKKGNQLRLRVR